VSDKLNSPSQKRKQNLQLLLECCDSAAGFARGAGLGYGLLMGVKHGQRELTPDLARKIETELELPPRWLDGGHASVAPEMAKLVREKARRPGVREDLPELSERRIANAVWLAGTARGNISAFCKRAGWMATEFSQMKTRPLGPKRAASLERALDLPAGWLDLQHDAQTELPSAFEDRLAAIHERDGTASREEAAFSPAVEEKLAAVKSPITRALIEKLLDVGARGLLPEAQAVKMLSEVVALEQ
jgi:hypothetical protein